MLAIILREIYCQDQISSEALGSFDPSDNVVLIPIGGLCLLTQGIYVKRFYRKYGPNRE